MPPPNDTEQIEDQLPPGGSFEGPEEPRIPKGLKLTNQPNLKIPKGLTLTEKPQQAQGFKIPQGLTLTDRPPDKPEHLSPGEKQFKKAVQWGFTPLIPEPSEATKLKIAAAFTGSTPEKVAKEHPIALGVTEGVTDVGRSLSTPFSIATIAGGPLIGTTGELIGMSPVAVQVVSRTLSALFAAQAAYGAYKDVGAAYEAYRQGNNRQAARAATGVVFNLGAAAFAGKHAARGGYEFTKGRLREKLPGYEEGEVTAGRGVRAIPEPGEPGGPAAPPGAPPAPAPPSVRVGGKTYSLEELGLFPGHEPVVEPEFDPQWAHKAAVKAEMEAARLPRSDPRLPAAQEAAAQAWQVFEDIVAGKRENIPPGGAGAPEPPKAETAKPGSRVLETPTGAAGTLPETGRATVTRELEPPSTQEKPPPTPLLDEIVDRINRHAETEAQLRRDLKETNIPPEDYPAVIAAIQQQGIDAYAKGDIKGVLEAAHHEILMERIAKETPPATPVTPPAAPPAVPPAPAVTPEAPAVTPPLVPPVITPPAPQQPLPAAPPPPVPAPPPPVQAPAPGYVAGVATKIGKGKKPTVSAMINEFMKRAAMEAQGQAILDEMIENKENPSEIEKTFWRDTYFKLPGNVQKRFQQMLKNVSGMQPGDYIGNDKDGNSHTAKTWMDIADHPLFGTHLGDDAQYLEGTDRGYAVMMREANRALAGVPSKAQGGPKPPPDPNLIQRKFRPEDYAPQEGVGKYSISEVRAFLEQTAEYMRNDPTTTPDDLGQIERWLKLPDFELLNSLRREGVTEKDITQGLEEMAKGKAAPAPAPETPPEVVPETKRVGKYSLDDVRKIFKDISQYPKYTGKTWAAEYAQFATLPDDELLNKMKEFGIQEANLDSIVAEIARYTPPAPTPAPAGIGKYSAQDVRRIIEAQKRDSGDQALPIYDQWLAMPDAEMIKAVTDFGVSESTLDHIVNMYGRQYGIKLTPQGIQPTVMGKYTMGDVRAIMGHLADKPGWTSFKEWLKLPDDELLNTLRENDEDERTLDYMVEQYGIKVPSAQPIPAAPKVALPQQPTVAPPAPRSPELEAALTGAGLNDPATMRVVGRAIQQGTINSKDQLDEVIQIAKTIKAMDQETTNIAAMIEATGYGGMHGLETVAGESDSEKINSPEAIVRANEVLRAVKKGPSAPPKKGRKQKPVTNIGKYPAEALRTLIGAWAVDPQKAEFVDTHYKKWLALPDDQLVKALLAEGVDEKLLDDDFRLAGITPFDLEQAGIKLISKGKQKPGADEGTTIDIAFARVAGGKVKLGADAEALGKVLGSSLYGKDKAEVITKELLQNAMDAIRQTKGLKEVTVEFNTIDHTITITDTGNGMTRHELETVFTDLGASGKRSDVTASGGFGIAKAAPLMMSQKLTVTTISKEKGKLYRHTFEATPTELLSEGVEIKTEELPNDARITTGTVITSELEPSIDFYQAKSFAEKSRNSIRLPGRLVVKGGTGRDDDVPKMKRAASTSVSGADIDIYTSVGEMKELGSYPYLEVDVNNNGIFQFTHSYYPPNEAAGVAVPKRISIDIRASVPEGDGDYPFTANRESLRGPTGREIGKLITEKIIRDGINAHNKKVATALENLPAIKIGALEIPVFDSGKRMTDAEIKTLLSDPAVIDLAHTINKLTREAIAALAAADLPYHLEKLGQKIRRIGLVFSDSVHGVHITDPVDRSKTALFVNPFADVRDNANRAASLIWHTIKHEIIHDAVSGHTEEFTKAEAAVSAALGGAHETRAIKELEDVYGDPGTAGEGEPGRVRPDLSRAIQLYADSRQRPEVAPDIFRGEGLSQILPTGDTEGVRTGGEGTVPLPARELEEPNMMLDVETGADIGAPVFDLDKAGKPRRPMPMPPGGRVRQRSNVVLREALPGVKEYQERLYRNWIESKRMKEESEAVDREEAALHATRAELGRNPSLAAIHRLNQEMASLNERRKGIESYRRQLRDDAEALDRSLNPNVGEVRLDADGNPTLYLNKTAMEMIRNIVRPGEADALLKGLAMSVGQARSIRNKIVIGGPANGDEQKVYPPFMRLLDMAIARSRNAGITLVSRTGQGIRSAIDTLREELIHRWQRMRSQSGHPSTHLSDDAFMRLFQGMPRAAYDYLRQNGYVGETPREEAQIHVIEAAAKIMAGKWRKMGLEKPDAVRWLGRYYEEVAQQHGVQAVIEVEHTYGVARDFQKELEKIYGTGKQATGTTATEATDTDAGRPLPSVERGRGGEAGGDAAGYPGRGGRGVSAANIMMDMERVQSSAPAEAKVYATKDDIETKKGWGEVYSKWKGKAGQGEGSLVKGVPLSKQEVTEKYPVLYHVSSAADKIMASGLLRAGSTDAEGGLGSSNQARAVSFTASRKDALDIAHDIGQRQRLADDPRWETLEQLAREDEKDAGLPENTFRLNKENYDFWLEQGENPEWALKAVHDMYLWHRQEHGGRQNTVIFGDLSTFRNKPKPRILSVPSSNIPDAALCRDDVGGHNFLHELQVDADVPVKGTRVVEPTLDFLDAPPTGTPEFKAWFRKSKVMDANGEPLKLYHGTTRKNPKVLRQSFEADLGIFLTDNDEVASMFTLPREYGETVWEDEDGNEIEPGDVVPLYARIENPLVIDDENENYEGPSAQEVSDDTALQTRTLKQAKADGHDGVILRNVKEGIGMGARPLGDTYIVFDSRQVKHAERNKGTYDPESPDILADVENQPRNAPAAIIERNADYWARFYRKHSFNTERKARDWFFGELEFRDTDPSAAIFGRTGTENNRIIADTVPLYREGRKFKIGRKPKAEPVSRQRLGSANPEGNYPHVDFHKQDLQDSGPVTEESIVRDYNFPRNRKAIAYTAYVPISEIPDAILAEEDESVPEEDRGTYNWQDFRIGRRAFPPAKLLVQPNGKVQIQDGNHRIKFWQEHGYDSIPAWVVDQRRGVDPDADTEEDEGVLLDIEKRGPQAKPLYHVTLTKNLKKINSKGLLRMQPTNWVQAGNRERYGQGEIYAFENLQDAVRWAGKMDWEFNKTLGSGKVSIVKFDRGAQEWNVDDADPLSQGGAKGKWLKSESRVPPEQILGSAPVTQDAMKALVQNKEPEMDFGDEGMPLADVEKQPDDRMIALHNTSAEGILAADRLGGIPAPSLAIVKPGMRFESFGDITLVGNRDMVDPDKNPYSKLYTSDVYSPRQPRASRKLNEKETDKFENKVRNAIPPDYREALRVRYGIRDKFNSYNPERWNELIRQYKSDAAVQYAYLQSIGKAPTLTPQPVRLKYEWLRSPEVKEALKNDPSLGDRKYDYNDKNHVGKITDLAKAAVLTEAERDASKLDRVAAGKPDAAKIRSATAKLLMNGAKAWIRDHTDEDGLLNYNPFEGIVKELHHIAKGDEPEIDQYDAGNKVRDALKENGGEEAVERFVKEGLHNAFGPEYLKTGRRKEPYALESVRQAMLGKGVRGQEDTMTHGMGRARAESAKQFRSIEAMRGKREMIQNAEENKAAHDALEKRFSTWWNQLEYNYPDTWDSLDALGRALGRYMKGAKTESNMRRALAAEEYKTEHLSPDTLREGMELAKDITEAPVEYFESKLTNAVSLADFSGAAVPEGTDPEVIDALKRKGLQVEMYKKYDRDARTKAVERIKDEERGILFDLEKPVQATNWSDPPRAEDTVDGLEVTDNIPNMDSISASMSDPEELRGIRELPLDAEWNAKPEQMFYSVSDIKRSYALAERIRESGKIDPLIVRIENGEPDILEGQHRLAALQILGKKSFPALVVVENDPPDRGVMSDVKQE